MAEHPIIMENKQLKVSVKMPGEAPKGPSAESVVTSTPEVGEAKISIAQKLSKYAFGEEISQPGKYIYKSYLEPTGKRVANDVLEYFLQLIKHTFQRWIWNGKVLDDGKWVDRTSYSKIYGNNGGSEPIKAMVMMSPVKELTFGTREDADRVLKSLKGIIANEKAATVRQYYELSSCPDLCEPNGVSSSSGWQNLDKVEVKEQPNGGGWYVDLPRPISLAVRK